MVHHISIKNSLKLYRQQTIPRQLQMHKVLNDRKILYYKDVNSFQNDLQMQHNFNEIATGGFKEHVCKKNTVKSKTLRMLQKEENKVTSLSPGFYKATVKGVSTWYTDRHNKAREQKTEPRNRPHQIQNLTCKLAGFAHHRRKV